MRRLFTIAAVVLAAGSVIFARSGMQAPGQEPEAEKKLIDLKSDNMGPIAPGDSVIFLVGNFAAQHNGAVITCDSAVRYSDMRIEFFGNVLINKNTTYIYGDRAEYNGELNEARVYSDTSRSSTAMPRSIPTGLFSTRRRISASSPTAAY